MLNEIEQAAAAGMPIRDTKLRAGVFGAEPWSEDMRRDIEAKLNLHALDIYGLSEIMGPGVACECELKCGLHGWEDHFLFEIIDPETGGAIEEPGRRGTMVITANFKQDGETLTGTHVSEMGEAPLKGTVKGVDVEYTLTLDMGGQQMSIVHKAKVDGNTMTGSAEIEGMGTITFTAKKKQ